MTTLTHPDIITPTTLSFIAPGVTIDSPSISINAVFNTTAYTYDVTNVTLSGAMTPVTPKHLRNLPLRKIIRKGLREELLNANPDIAKIPAAKSFFKGTHGKKLAEKKVDNPTEEVFTNVALVYALATLCGEFTNISVARVFNIEPFKARRLVSQAKQHGYIEKAS